MRQHSGIAFPQQIATMIDGGRHILSHRRRRQTGRGCDKRADVVGDPLLVVQVDISGKQRLRLRYWLMALSSQPGATVRTKTRKIITQAGPTSPLAARTMFGQEALMARTDFHGPHSPQQRIVDRVSSGAPFGIAV